MSEAIDELAFYDALAENESAVDGMGNEQLPIIARKLLAQVRNSVSIHWTLQESARAKIRVMVKRILSSGKSDRNSIRSG